VRARDEGECASRALSPTVPVFAVVPLRSSQSGPVPRQGTFADASL